MLLSTDDSVSNIPTCREQCTLRNICAPVSSYECTFLLKLNLSMRHLKVSWLGVNKMTYVVTKLQRKIC